MEILTIVIILLVAVFIIFNVIKAVKSDDFISEINIAVILMLCILFVVRGWFIESEIRVRYEKAILNNSYEIRTEYNIVTNKNDTVKNDSTKYLVIFNK